ncbi:hypothetical protein HKD42_08205 [Altererythrobacter sp. RZ02]|uniref:Uncharacterized protein n=1 Tax=Pontixanthobacter rizhaonensis TaxID=2730337 RepID=A0A848QEH3_9SPHN|nr:hypothetical protein [Pontixanthobacter rizhaonensis]NMW32041.1 hypothetical protein [Pontixanthobacter rizhaonensis]
MGGYNSGRQGGRPIAEQSLKVDLALMLRKGWIAEGRSNGGSLSWSRGGEPAGNIQYYADLSDPANASLTLNYKRQRYGEDWISREQHIRLDYTQPHFGGRRWWMICPVRGVRAGKLYLPSNGDIFAGRQAWRLGYKSQRIAPRDKPFEALFRLQRRLGCNEGWEQPIRRPKGMWRQTYDRLEQEYWELNLQCSYQMMALVNRLRG